MRDGHRRRLDRLVWRSIAFRDHGNVSGVAVVHELFHTPTWMVAGDFRVKILPGPLDVVVVRAVRW